MAAHRTPRHLPHRKHNMFRLFKPLYAFALSVVILSGCDNTRILDENREIPGYNWYYKDKVGFDVVIEDTNLLYNMYINARIRADYRYNNLFVLLHTQLPDKKELKQRFEIPIADDLGKWYGKGLGDIYDYQYPILQQVHFAQRGIYRFSLEQNMRDDTLYHVVAAGLRIEKAGTKN